MKFIRLARAVRASVSPAAMSLALLAGGAVAMTAATTPAAAKEKPAKPAKADYSKGFVAVYTPANALLTAATPDIAGAEAQIEAVVAAAQTADDRNAAGSFILTVGQKKSDNALMLRGLEMMLESGKVGADRLGLINFSAGQLAYNTKNYAKARQYIQAALDVGYVQEDAEALIAESYFDEDRHAEGLAYLSKVIADRKAAGKPVKESWVKRGLAIAYTNQLKAESAQFATLYAADFPSATSWGDAVAVTLNMGGYENPEILDLLRLARRTGSFRDDRMFLEYLDAADYRRLPAEVVAVIDEGLAKGLVKSNNAYVADIRTQAAARAAVDQRDLAVLLKDARASGATINAVLAAGDTLLSMGKPAEAEEFYVKAQTVPGANTALVLTRLGIAQFDQGKYADAQATFAKVQGSRQAIASLWSAYARQKAAPAQTAAAPVQ